MPPRVKSSQIRQRIRKLRSPERMQTYRVMMLKAALALLLTRITKDLGARGTVLGVGSREPSARAPPQVRARPRRDGAAASELPESLCTATL